MYIDDIHTAYFSIPLNKCLRPFCIVSLVSVIIAIYVSAHPHVAPDDDNPGRTSFIRRTYQIHPENGSIYVEYASGTREQLKNADKPKYVNNMTRFVFGVGVDNYCNERNISKSDWFTSIYRASQLYSSVQAPMRIAILLVMTPMCFFAYVNVKMYYVEQQTIFSLILSVIHVTNELIFFLSLFEMFTIHVFRDFKYLPYAPHFFKVFYVTTVIKLLSRAIMENFDKIFIFRYFGILIIILSYPIISKDIQDYSEEVYCDTFVTHDVTLFQLAYILILIINYWIDVRKSRMFHLLLSPIVDDEICYRDFNRNKNIFIQNY